MTVTTTIEQLLYMVHTSANTGAVLCRVQTLLRLLRGIDLGGLWRNAGCVRGHHHGRRTDQSHGRSCARPHHERAALVIERDHLECVCGRTGRQATERGRFIQLISGSYMYKSLAFDKSKSTRRVCVDLTCVERRYRKVRTMNVTSG